MDARRAAGGDQLLESASGLGSTVLAMIIGSPSARPVMRRLSSNDKGLMGTRLRYPYEVHSEREYLDDIQDAKDMLDLAKHIANQKIRSFEPDKFEDQCETAHASTSLF